MATPLSVQACPTAAPAPAPLPRMRDYKRSNNNGVSGHTSSTNPFLRLLDGCSDMSQLRQIHAQMFRSGLTSDVPSASRVIAFCALDASGSINYARLVFDQIPKRTSFMFNCIIRGYTNKNLPLDALFFYSEVLESGLVPDNFTFPSLFKSCGDYNVGRQLHCQVVKWGFVCDAYVQNTLMGMYSDCGSLRDAREVFEKMNEKTVVSWATMIAAYTHWDQPGCALGLFRQMKFENVTMNYVILVNVLSASGMARDLEMTKVVHECINENLIESNPVLTTALMDAYCKCGCMAAAREVFSAVQEKNSFYWNIMIHGLVEDSEYEEALSLFRDMQLEVEKANKVTMASLLLACSHLGALGLGRWLHSYIYKENIEVDVVLGTALVDMYGKCGCAESAPQVFHGPPSLLRVDDLLCVGASSEPLLPPLHPPPPTYPPASSPPPEILPPPFPKLWPLPLPQPPTDHRLRHLVEVPPPQRAPLLFYPSPSSGTGKFHNIVDGRCEDLEIPHLHHADCLASAHGWLLLKNCRSGKLYLFNPSSSKRLSLPRLEEEKEPSVYIFSSAPGRQDCFIVGTYRLCPYFLYSPPRGKRWEKYELNIDQTGCILANTSCNGKVYMFTSKMELAIIDFAPLLSVQYLNTSWIDSLSAYDMITSLVSSSGDLFLVEKYLYHHTEPSIIRTVQVFKLDFSLKTWESVDSINNAVFVVGPDHVESFLAANTGLKGDGIYFVDDDALYCFDLQYRSLTVSYTCSSSYNGWEPFWLLHDDILVNQQERNQVIPNLEERVHFDHPKFVLPPPSRGGQFLQQHAFLPLWCPRNPCLMFTHKNDGTYKILDPCSKNTYELHLPELSGSTILTAKGGWLLARVKKSVLFINPFTKQTVNLPKFKVRYRLFGVAFSSPPTCPDCIVFFITSSGFAASSETQVTIYIYHSDGKNWITREFENNIPFLPSHSSPVFHNGLFYCLGLNGNCGVYNPREDTWSILSTPVGIHCEAYKCSLVESCGKLLSVFVDRFQELIGVFEFDFAHDRWKQITDLVDKMLFFGLEASYCVTASVEEQQNRIYYPSFQREYCLDLVVHSLKTSNTLERCSKTEYLHVWIEPKGFVHVLDPVRGKFYLRIT